MKPYHTHVYVCTSSKCGDSEPKRIIKKMRTAIEERNLRDKIWVTKSGCTMQHKCGPVIITIYPEGIWYKNVSLDDVDQIVDEHLVNGHIVERLLHYKMEDGIKS
jgi:(2Fe-2S) ferredoxin|tara:strand:+ start:883 stop:1197 length:315 start_codon:yes stop_codon:yes gene_type:complete